MKKCIVIPDSFKGSLSSLQICEIARQSIGKFFPDCQVVTLPVADGGEGTVDCFLSAMPGERVTLQVHGPYMEQITACYARFGDTAIIEMASAAGLPMVGERKDPSATTTYGVGEQLLHAVKHGAKKIILGLGGSATNDAGCGAAAAAGVVFLDGQGVPFVPTGGTLSRIASYDCTKARQLFAGVEITCMCDIDNPMYGPSGAAFVFGPQKGADPQMVQQLDQQLRALAKLLPEGTDHLAGAGAAGAMGAGMVAFLGAQLRSGIETVLDVVDFDRQLEGTDLVLTGEGKIDSQSLRGKVVIGVARRAAAKQVPVCAVVGDVGDDAYDAYSMGVSTIFSTNRLAIPFSQAKLRSEQDYRHTLEDLLRLIQTVQQMKKS